MQSIRYHAGKEKLINYVNYYMPEVGDDQLSMVKDVTDDLTQVFERLSAPLGKIMDVHE